jgi:hypothetical protein
VSQKRLQNIFLSFDILVFCDEVFCDESDDEPTAEEMRAAHVP